ncbi:SSI family serine proteinase inhibitor [Geodermatophilus sp. SYSU D00742]
MLTVLLLLALVSCASPSGGGSAGDGTSAPAPGSGDAGGADDELVVVVDAGDGSPVERWTLVCGDPAGGDHPDARAACDHLRQLTDPFAPIPADAVCTEQYGGPQTAHVTGRWAGRPVDLEVSRTDGCRIAQWDSLVPLLPEAVAVEQLPS